MKNKRKRPSQFTPRNHNGPVKPLRVPVITAEEDEDICTDDEDDDGDDEDYREHGLRKATAEQRLTGLIYRERQERLKLLQRNANLEQEMATLRKEVADTRIALMQDTANKIGPANAALFAEVGLKEGDQLSDNIEGHEGTWVVIPKAET